MGIRYYKPVRENLVLNSNMNVDSNADGKCDNWTMDKGAGWDATFSIENNSQRIDLTATTAGYQTVWCYQVVPNINAGDKISVSVDYIFTLLTGGVICRLYFAFKNSSNNIISGSEIYKTTLNSGSGTFQNLNLTAPTNTAKAHVEVQLQSYPDVGTGTAWFTNAILVKENSIGNYFPSGSKNMNLNKSIKYVR